MIGLYVLGSQKKSKPRTHIKFNLNVYKYE